MLDEVLVVEDVADGVLAVDDVFFLVVDVLEEVVPEGVLVGDGERVVFERVADEFDVLFLTVGGGDGGG